MNSTLNLETLEGEFVNLRRLNVDDAALTFAWRQGDRAHLLNQGARSVEEQAKWIASRPSDEYNFIIETRQRQPIGMLSLGGINFASRVGEPGRFLIGNEEAAKGIPAAAESMKLLYELAFDHLKLRRIWGFIASSNVRMIKWQIYLGLVEEGRQREHLFIGENFQDAVLFGLLEREYRRITLPRLDALISVGRLHVAASNSKE